MAVRPKRKLVVIRLARSAALLLLLSYAGFAVSSAAAEVMHQLGFAGEVKLRSAPLFFIVHALAGTIALVTGPLQWIHAWRRGKRRPHRVANHRTWMTRSYALTLLFVTGPIGMSAAEAVSLPYEVAYPVAVSLAWMLNLAVSEIWIRRASWAYKTPRRRPRDNVGFPTTFRDPSGTLLAPFIGCV